MASNNDNSGAALGFGVMAAALVVMAMIVYAIACFIALVFTALSLLALHRPLRLWGDNVITPAEAKVFLASGLIGAIGVPVFALFCAYLFDSRVDPEWWFYLVTGGYAFMSISVACYLAEHAPEVLADPAPTIDHIPLQAPPRAMPAPAEPFRYASWDDEEEA